MSASMGMLYLFKVHCILLRKQGEMYLLKLFHSMTWASALLVLWGTGCGRPLDTGASKVSIPRLFILNGMSGLGESYRIDSSMKNKILSSRCNGHPTSFAQLVDCYMVGAYWRLRGNLFNYKNYLPNYSSFIHHCVYGHKETAKGHNGPVDCRIPTSSVYDVVIYDTHKHWHQHRVAYKYLQTFEIHVSKLNLSGFADFDAFFDYVASNCGLKDGRCLLTYDFCIRYGYDKGLLPQQYVYLYRGAKSGAEALFGHPILTDKLDIRCFYPYLGTKLESIDIENLLCDCKERISCLKQPCSLCQLSSSCPNNVNIP